MIIVRFTYIFGAIKIWNQQMQGILRKLNTYLLSVLIYPGPFTKGTLCREILNGPLRGISKLEGQLLVCLQIHVVCN